MKLATQPAANQTPLLELDLTDFEEAPVQSLPALQVPTLQLMPLSTDLRLAVLASEINLLTEARIDSFNRTIALAVRSGFKLIEAQQHCGERFEHWLTANFTFAGKQRLSRSQAYEYMRLAKDRPHLADETHQSAAHHLSVSHLFALAGASAEVEAEVFAKVEKGEIPTVKQIKELQKQSKKQQKRITQLELEVKENQDLKTTNDALLHQVAQLSSDEGIAKLVEQQVAAKTSEVFTKAQADLDNLVQQVERDNQQRMDLLVDQLARAKDDLAKAKGGGEIDAINQKIAEAQDELDSLNAKRNTANRINTYNGIASHLINQSADLIVQLTDLIEVDTFLPQATNELLLRAAHDFEHIAQLMRNAAMSDQVDIEGLQ